MAKYRSQIIAWWYILGLGSMLTCHVFEIDFGVDFKRSKV